MSMNPSPGRYQIAGAMVMSVSTAALLLLACAESMESAFDRADSSVGLPGAERDAGNDTPDAFDGSDAALPEVPCAVGNVCRVQTPLTRGAISAMSGRSRSDVWAAGTRGLMMRWDGQGWTELDSSEEQKESRTLTSLSLGDDETWGVAGMKLVRRGIDPDSVQSIEIRGPCCRVPTSIVVLADGTKYVGTSRGSWSPTASGLGLLYDVTSFNPALMPVMPDPVVASTGEPSPMNIRAMAHVPERVLWTVGDRGGVARYPLEARDAGERWALGRGVVFPLPIEHDLFAAWADGDQLWVAGDGGVIVHFDGAEWHVQRLGTTAALRAIFGISATDIWAAGDAGALWHFDGTSWSQVPIQSYSGSLRAVWGGAPDDVWIGGEGGMFHWGPLP